MTDEEYPAPVVLGLGRPKGDDMAGSRKGPDRGRYTPPKDRRRTAALIGTASMIATGAGSFLSSTNADAVSYEGPSAFAACVLDATGQVVSIINSDVQSCTGYGLTQIPLGIQGFQGFQGAQGYQGSPGMQGSPGSGSQGAQGNQGYQGAQGPQGLQGSVGVGSQGAQGYQGYQGVQGAQGLQGSVGVGSQGPQGFQGAQGPQGLQGSVGVGSQGPQGYQGAQGPQGAQGAQGQTGVGSQGNQGAQGAQGASGGETLVYGSSGGVIPLRYIGTPNFVGVGMNSGTEGNVAQVVDTTITVTHLYVDLGTAPGSGNTWTVGLRVNGVTEMFGTISGSNTTAVITGSASLVPGDTVDVIVDGTSGAPNVTTVTWSAGP